MKSLFRRCDHNPIITVDQMPSRCQAVFNPGAVEHDGEVVLLLRSESNAGYSSIYKARSKNGVDNWKIDHEPLLAYGQPGLRYEAWGVEDPRVVYLAEEDCYYITYTAYSPAGAAVGLARSRDLCSVERVSLIFGPNNKDASIFPEKIDGRWAALHRPAAEGGIENIWVAFSKDLEYWGEPHCVITESSGPGWDSERVGGGPPPIKTDQGWLLIYHGVKLYGGQRVYRAGAAMLDLENIHKMVARTPGCIFEPQAEYEVSGLMPNVVFPSGLIRRGDELWMYYGAADSFVGLAVTRLDLLTGALEPV